MNTATSYRSSSRSISDLKAHLVLTTKYRRKAISGAMLQRLNEIIHELSAKWGVEVVEVNGEPDHLHLLFGYYPQLQLSKYINNLKTVSSRMLRQEAAIKGGKLPPFFAFLRQNFGLFMETSPCCGITLTSSLLVAA